MDGYRGEERRMANDDHDILIEIRGDVKNLVSNFNAHLVDDKHSFTKVAKDQDFTNKIFYGGMGVILFVEFYLKVIQ